MTNVLSIIDLSHHNPTPDFAKAEAGGLVGIIHKCTEGTSYTDDMYWPRRQPAEDAGLSWASYHFLKHGNARDQMDFYMAKAVPLKGSRVVIDYEDPDCTLDDLHEAVEALQAMSSTLQITVYSGSLIKEQLGSTHDALLAKTSLWIAQYTTAEQPSWPSGTWPVWSLWQYSDGQAGGQPRAMAGCVPPFDCNAFNGSLDQCRKWMGPAGQEPVELPPPVPQPGVGLVRVNIEATDGVEVEVYVNGWRVPA